MTAMDVQQRNRTLAEYLQLLRWLASELDRAMDAIAGNSLSDLEESISKQQALSTRLSELSAELGALTANGSASAATPAAADKMVQIRQASAKLQILNQRYSALIQMSSHSVTLMVSLFSSYRGQLQEEAGPTPTYRTWSSQV